MKRTTISMFLCLAASLVSAQHTGFRKTIENKYGITQFKDGQSGKETEGFDNVDSKSSLEKLLFGNTNAAFEFTVEPSFAAAYGIRVVKDSSGASPLLEVKRIVNWEDVEKQMQKAFPVKGHTAQELDALIAEREKMSEEEKESAELKRRMRNEKREQETLKRYQVEAVTVPVTESFAEKLYTEFVSFIDDFKGGELAPGLRGDGEIVTFRTVVDHEVRTLAIFFKTEDEAQQFTDLCKRMIADIEAGKFDQSEYVKLLKK